MKSSCLLKTRFVMFGLLLAAMLSAPVLPIVPYSALAKTVVQAPAIAVAVSPFLQSVVWPLVPSETAALKTAMAQPTNLLTLLKTSSSIALQCEGVRQASVAFTRMQQQELLKGLNANYLANKTKTGQAHRAFFLYGWAQMLLQHNKTGLFFLRKANDVYRQPDTMLAYALAQVDADLYIERAQPTVLTTRKIDVIGLFRDAVASYATVPVVGFWPRLVSGLSALKAFPAYNELTGQDLSRLVVPYGKTPTLLPVTVSQLPANVAKLFKTLPQTSPLPDLPRATGCGEITPPAQQKLPAVTLAQLTTMRALAQPNSTVPTYLLFFQVAPQQYQLWVVNTQGQLLGKLNTSVAPYVAEDVVNNDGRYELVVRQMAQEPLAPVKVWAIGPCSLSPVGGPKLLW